MSNTHSSNTDLSSDTDIISQSTPPSEQEFSSCRIQAIIKIQNKVRKYIACKEVQKRCRIYIDQIFDPKYDCYFYYNKKMDVSSWSKPKFMGDDYFKEMSLASRKIQKMFRKHLEKRDLNSKELRTNQAESNTKQDIKEDLSFLAKDIKTWTTDNVIEWFCQIGLKQYIDKIAEYDVDGLLLMRLGEEELEEIGITSKIQIRKFQVNVEKYKPVSSSKPVIDDFNVSVKSNYECDLKSKNIQETRQTVQEVDQNNNKAFTKEIMFRGEDGMNPHEGDTVQIYYTIAVDTKDNIIENSRNRRNEPFQFVVGTGQVVDGLDYTIRTFCRGERSMVKISSDFAYGTEGFPPLIPSNATLFCDVELISISHEVRATKLWIQNTDN